MSICDIIVTMKIKGLYNILTIELHGLLFEINYLIFVIFKTEFWGNFFLSYWYFGIKNRFSIKNKTESGFKCL